MVAILLCLARRGVFISWGLEGGVGGDSMGMSYSCCQRGIADGGPDF